MNCPCPRCPPPRLTPTRRGNLGAARLGLGDAAGAVEAYEKGLALKPSNAALKDGLAQARKIANDPTTRSYLDQPDFMQMLRDLQRNPGNLNNYLSDPRMLQVFSLMLNVKVQNQNNEASEPKSPAPAPSKSPPPAPHQQKNPSSPRILYWTTPTFSSPMGGSGEWQRWL
ncbi:Heat shock protein STI [Hordeum vulgare]|nr:Heat shock protein STI [Hordeum vulgare]